MFAGGRGPGWGCEVTILGGGPAPRLGGCGRIPGMRGIPDPTGGCDGATPKLGLGGICPGADEGPDGVGPSVDVAGGPGGRGPEVEGGMEEGGTLFEFCDPSPLF